MIDEIKPQDKIILVVNTSGLLKQLYIPFRVKCIRQVSTISVDQLLYVEAVQMHPDYLLIYYIHQKWYPFSFFQITLP